MINPIQIFRSRTRNPNKIMSKSLMRKVEDAVIAYLTAEIGVGDGLENVTLHPARGDKDVRTLPKLLVYCQSAPENPNLPKNVGEFVANLQIKLMIHVDDSSIVEDDAAARQMNDLMQCTSDILTALNKPSVGPDLRTQTDVYFYDFKIIGNDSDFGDERLLEDIMTFDVPCRDDDGDGTGDTQ